MNNAPLNKVINNSIIFADNVLKNLVAHTLNVALEDIFDNVVPNKQPILINYAAKNKKYYMSLDIVDKDYMLDLGELRDEKVFESVKGRMIFLLNTVKMLYCPIKDYMKKWASERGQTFDYMLEIDMNTTLYLDRGKEKRIGIILKEA